MDLQRVQIPLYQSSKVGCKGLYFYSLPTIDYLLRDILTGNPSTCGLDLLYPSIPGFLQSGILLPVECVLN